MASGAAEGDCDHRRDRRCSVPRSAAHHRREVSSTSRSRRRKRIFRSAPDGKPRRRPRDGVHLRSLHVRRTDERSRAIARVADNRARLMAKQHAGVAAIFVVLAVVMTWPLTPNINRAVAYPGDPFITTWVLDWDWYATFHQPLHLFDADLFYPARYSLAYSEHLYGIAVFLFPLRAIAVSPIAAHNIAILAGFALSGFATYLLGRLVTGSAMAGLVAGVFYAFLPFRFTHLPHVHYVWGWTVPALLAALLWYSQKPTWARAILFGVAFLENGLSNVHWFFFGSFAIAVTIVMLRPRIAPIAVCGAIAAAIIAAFLFPYYE